MDFLRRLKYYLIGVGMGTLLVWGIFKDRELGTWTPKNQVNEDIQKMSIDFTSYIECKLACLEIDTILLKQKVILGDINFKESEVEDQKDRTYVIELEDEVINSIQVNISTNALDFVEINTKANCPCND